MKRALPPERLLVFEPKDGWNPLCDFLDKPVPANLPFPHVNKGRSTKRKLRKLRVQKYLPHAALIVLVVAYFLL